jgi:hypothetical protein
LPSGLRLKLSDLHQERPLLSLERVRSSNKPARSSGLVKMPAPGRVLPASSATCVHARSAQGPPPASGRACIARRYLLPIVGPTLVTRCYDRKPSRHRSCASRGYDFLCVGKGTSLPRRRRAGPVVWAGQPGAAARCRTWRSRFWMRDCAQRSRADAESEPQAGRWEKPAWGQSPAASIAHSFGWG